MTTLTTTDQLDLAKLESIIEKACVSAFEGGRALREVRDRKLYLDTHETFEEYCQDRWDFNVRNAELKMHAARVYDILEAHNCALLPRFEAQTRPLHREKNEDVADIWDNAVKLAPVVNGKPRITEAVVQQAVRDWYTSDDEPETIDAVSAPVDEEEEEEGIEQDEADPTDIVVDAEQDESDCSDPLLEYVLAYADERGIDYSIMAAKLENVAAKMRALL